MSITKIILSNKGRNKNNELLCRMTSDQRSLCLDDFDEIPLMFEKVMTKVKEEEIV